MHGDARAAMLAEDLDCIGASLDGLALLGRPGGAAWLQASAAGIALEEGLSPDGSWCRLLLFGDGRAAIAEDAPGGGLSLRSFPTAAAAWEAWDA